MGKKKKHSPDEALAREAQAKIDAANEAAQNLEKNMRQDLNNQNVANVLAGGSALSTAAAGKATVDIRKKQRPQRRSSQLGVQV